MLPWGSRAFQVTSMSPWQALFISDSWVDSSPTTLQLPASDRPAFKPSYLPAIQPHSQCLTLGLSAIGSCSLGLPAASSRCPQSAWWNTLKTSARIIKLLHRNSHPSTVANRRNHVLQHHDREDPMLFPLDDPLPQYGSEGAPHRIEAGNGEGFWPPNGHIRSVWRGAANYKAAHGQKIVAAQALISYNCDSVMPSLVPDR